MRKLSSVILILTLLASCKKPEVQYEILLVAYPNPATSTIFVYVKNEQKQACTIRLFDPNAKQISELKIEAGNPTDGIRFDLEGQDRGTYQVVAEIGGNVWVEKFYKV